MRAYHNVPEARKLFYEAVLKQFFVDKALFMSYVEKEAVLTFLPQVAESLK